MVLSVINLLATICYIIFVVLQGVGEINLVNILQAAN